MFKDMRETMPTNEGNLKGYLERAMNKSRSLGLRSMMNSLEVITVGSYKCSIAPSIEDIKRANKDVFTLPANIENLLKKHYEGKSFSFFICKLTKNGEQHPLGYVHNLLRKDTLFVPTRHDHGDKKGAVFDHYIYSADTTDRTVSGNSVGDIFERT
eukprot:UN13668